MAALQYVNEPEYAALLLRRTYREFNKPGALMDRAGEWLGGTDAKWNGEHHVWTFPSGAQLAFGYLDGPRDKEQYQSAEFQFVGFDELTEFKEDQYLYLFTRMRRLVGSKIPIRMRSASNPGGIGHDWVKARFVDPGDPERPFVRALFTENPHLDQETYRRMLDKVDAVTRAQLFAGDWDVLPTGDMFKREKAEIVPEAPANLTAWVRYWDKAGTPGGGDWTAGVLMAKAGATYYVLDVVRGQWGAADRRVVMHQTAVLDAGRYPNVHTWVEQEPGSSGKESAENTIADLAGFAVFAETSTGSKVVRATPLSAQWGVGNVRLVGGAWNRIYIDEMMAFPNGPHDDQVDASSGAFMKLTTREYEQGTIRYA